MHSRRSCGLPKNCRLLSAGQFQQVFQAAHRLRTPGFTVLARRNDKGIARLGLAVPKRHCRKAVVRNRLKRIARESFRLNRDTLPPLDLVLLCTPQAPLLQNRDIFLALETALQCLRVREWRDP